MVHYSTTAIENMEKSFRVNFINSLSGFKSSNLVATVDKQGNPNLAMFSSAVHLGADPALMGLVSRPRSVERHSVENLLDTGLYSINHVNKKILKAAHQTAARYPREQSEFDATGLTAEYLEEFAVPVVAESQLNIVMKLVEAIPIEVNNTEFIIGEIKKVIVRGNVVNDDGFIDIEALGSVSLSGLDSYHETQRIGRLSYPKPDKEPRFIP